jgi:hypothetical protein
MEYDIQLPDRRSRVGDVASEAMSGLAEAALGEGK